MALTLAQATYAEALSGSRDLYDRAVEVFPGGVTHDNRHYGPFPIYVDRAAGTRKWDVDGREYVDYWMGHGALLFGHAHPPMVAAVQAQVALGTHFGACHALEVAWGEWVRRLVPTAERVRFTSSGTEATLMALRLSRTFTGRRKVLKFLGHFHGWHDNLIIGVTPPFDRPVPPGILPGVAESVLLCPPNDIDRVEDLLKVDPDVACVFIEPTGASFGTIPTRPGFLEDLRDVTARHDVLLVFDEVVTGFRCAPGGVQGITGIRPDLTTLAKVLSGGLPGGCLTGRADILGLLTVSSDPSRRARKMPHQGTFNANPLSAAAGIATLSALADGEACRLANEAGARLRGALQEVFDARGLRWAVYGDYSGIKLLPDCDGEGDVAGRVMAGAYDYALLKSPSSPRLREAFHEAMALEGVDFAGFTGLTSALTTGDDIALTAAALDRAVDRLAAAGLASPER